MPALLHSSRVDLLELKAQIVRKIGYKRSEKYFCHLKVFLSNKITKSKFDRICSNTIGRENIILHNNLIQSIIKNACFAVSPPAYTTKSVNSVNRSQGNHSSICTDAIPWSPRKSRSANIRDRKFSDRPSPLKPVDKVQGVLSDELVSRLTVNGPALTGSYDIKRLQEQQSEVFSVEDGEEVEQIPETSHVQSRSPLEAPLGIQTRGCIGREPRFSLPVSGKLETCGDCLELPDFKSLKSRVEHKLMMQGLNVSDDCIHLLNNGLDALLKRLIKPCLELAKARHTPEQPLSRMMINRYMQKSNCYYVASLLDFRVAMETNSQLLGCNWPVQLEKICLCSSEE